MYEAAMARKNILTQNEEETSLKRAFKHPSHIWFRGQKKYIGDINYIVKRVISKRVKSNWIWMSSMCKKKPLINVWWLPR